MSSKPLGDVYHYTYVETIHTIKYIFLQVTPENINIPYFPFGQRSDNFRLILQVDSWDTEIQVFYYFLRIVMSIVPFTAAEVGVNSLCDLMKI